LAFAARLLALRNEGTAVVCASQHGLLYPLAIGDEVNFRLTYDGPLKAASQSDTRRVDKHAMRRVFSRQLGQLFNHKPVFHDELMRSTDDVIGQLRRRGDFICLPLVRANIHLVCDLDVLFLRRENPGGLISGGGDLDNRIKVLFDALRMPLDDNEVRGETPDNKNDILFCLTEDDGLITGFRVTTDRLLEPANSTPEEHHVRLIINVEVKATKLTAENMGYFSHF
jgi:hypothetical protein